MQLVTSKNEINYKGTVSSTTMNEFVEDVHYDLSQLMSVATEHAITIPEHMKTLLRENYFVTRKIEALQATLANLANVHNGVAVHSFASDTNIVSQNNVTVDTVHGIAHADIQSTTSKVHLLDLSGKPMVPRALSVRVYETENPIADITDERLPFTYDQSADANLVKAFDGDIDTVWTREYRSPTATSLNVVMHIDLPTNIANHMRVNSITIDPCPEYSMTLHDIQYQTTTGNWYRFDTYPVDTQPTGQEPVPFDAISNIKFVMPRKDVTAVVLHFSQPTWFTEGTDRVFVYGFRNIDIDYVRFDNATTGKVRVKMQHPLGQSFHYIKSASAVWPETGIESGVSLALYTDPETQFPWPMGWPMGDDIQSNPELALPVGTKDIYIEASINCDATGTTPLISGIKVEYVSVDE